MLEPDEVRDEVRQWLTDHWGNGANLNVQPIPNPAYDYPSPNANPRSACSKAGTCRRSPWPFFGRMRDATFSWPARAAGIPLTLRVLVRVKGMGSAHADYAVRVRR